MSDEEINMDELLQIETQNLYVYYHTQTSRTSLHPDRN